MENNKEQQSNWVDALNQKLLVIEQDIKQLVDDFFEHRAANQLLVEQKRATVNLNIQYIALNKTRYSSGYPFFFSTRKDRGDIISDYEATELIDVMKLMREVTIPIASPPCYLYFNLLHNAHCPKKQLTELKSVTAKMSFENNFGFTISENGTSRTLKF
jgi:hypothetical protein